MSQALIASVVYPPEGKARKLIDKTAKFVARLGAEFESKVSREANKAEFAFLLPTDVHHAYYQHKIQEFKGGEALPEPTPEQVVARGVPELEAAQEVRSELIGQATTLVEMRELDRRRGKVVQENPYSEKYILYLPPDLPEVNLEVMKLTAQFTAKNGIAFQQGLLNREQRNPMFNFLKPMHSLHAMYQRLLTGYQKAVLPGSKIVEECERLRDQDLQLALALDRWTFESERERERAEKEAAHDRERELNALIDWQDFVIVGTLDFEGDDVTELPPLVTIPELRALARLGPADTGATGQEEGDMDMDMDMDMEESDDMDTGDDAAEAEAEALAKEAMLKAERGETEEIELPTTSADIDVSKIRAEFKRDAGAQLAKASRVQVCPRCGQEVPVDEMAEHMRIELLNPKYLQQRQINERKTTENAFVGTSEAVANLQKLARKRTDIFGDSAGGEAYQTAAERAAAAESAPGGMSALDQQLAQIKKQTELPDSKETQKRIEQQESFAEQQRQAAIQQQMPMPPNMPSMGQFAMPPGMPPGMMPMMPPGMMPPGMPMMPPGMMPPGMMPPGMMPPGMMPPGMMPPGMMPPQGMPPNTAAPPNTMAAPPTDTTATQAPPTQAPPQNAAPPQQLSGQVRPAEEDNGPPAKRARVEQTEEAAPPPVVGIKTVIQVIVPNDPSKSHWNFNGQELSFTLDTSQTVGDLKQQISEALGGMPSNKQKLHSDRLSALLSKDSLPLSAYNFLAEEIVTLTAKTRGGRKK